MPSNETAKSDLPLDLATLSEALDDVIEAGFQRQVQWLGQLVSFGSVRGNEALCQDWLASEFQARGWLVDQFAIADVPIAGKPGASPAVDVDYAKAMQVVASLPDPDPAHRSLILQGHIDVVPPGAPELWDRDPFQPKVENGFMWGRGTNDMKAGVCEMVFALDALRALGYVPAGQVFVETVSEEECTGNGALATLERGYRADACLIPESLDHRLLRAELGSVWFRARILGRPGHVLSASRTSNAILAAFEYVADLEELTKTINEEAKQHPWFGHIESPVKFSLGKIQGGDWLGSVPSWCEIECRLSVLPDDPLPMVRQRVLDCISACAKRLSAEKIPDVTWIGFQADGHVFQPGSEAEAVLSRCHRYVMGTELETFSQTATSDTRQYDLYYGIPTLCYGGRGFDSHSPRERTDLDSVKSMTKIIAIFIADWSGLRQISVASG
ncbi:ArgE/DapE family deacylase [Agrobacterium vitis]|uniref:ArgE/DapE family deacylase n=1 Tax=Agrobacterium vitis TaxID=373 RepID=UPI000873277A|nr:ArgE/DapE family deacylase [Agrobacterium vitis]MCE6076953.1 ArgE/DapE family deacylase [Agrobacterium vitis]MCF1454974.1 ArgE/DapE family deacylase [Agrobacterium vitis]MCF1469305.1 ArgE/DapE family deacylase [Agrobacterium vitis]MUO71726.1 ArgE/DapE family deacylase [Agrobacterium vitis]MUO86196.1 ArgE/DapE family deacylase [Agrobacterium vitis]